MKEQRSISVPGINLEQDADDSDSSTTRSDLEPNQHETSAATVTKDTLAQNQPIRPGTLYEVLMALKERER